MIHLFGKVYLAHEANLDLQYDRVVVSATNAVPVPDTVQKISGGALINYAASASQLVGKGKPYASYVKLFSELGAHSDSNGVRVFIFADAASFETILSNWYGIILPNIDEAGLVALGKSIQFKFNVFNRGSRSSVSINDDNTIDMGDLVKVAPNETKELTAFIDKYKGQFGVEYMIASYLSSGAYKDELKATMAKIYKKSLEVLLTDIKEGFLVTLIHKGFADKVGLDNVYTFENFTDILNDKSEIAELFLSERLWHSPWIKLPSSSSSASSNLKVENITPEDAAAFKQAIVDFAEYSMGDLIWNSTIKKEEIKLDFTQAFTDFTDELLDDMLAADRDSESVHGAFFPINLETVNHYLIRSLMYAHESGDQEYLSKFALR